MTQIRRILLIFAIIAAIFLSISGCSVRSKHDLGNIQENTDLQKSIESTLSYLLSQDIIPACQPGEDYMAGEAIYAYEYTNTQICVPLFTGIPNLFRR